MKSRKDRNNTDELLIDYLEGEMGDSLRADFDLLINNSHDQNRKLKAFKGTRYLIEDSEGEPPELSDAAFDRLHSRIMAEVAESKPQSVIQLWWTTQSWRPVAAVAGVALVTSLLLFNLIKTNVKLETAGIRPTGDLMLSISVEVPEAWANSILNDRDSNEFYLEAAAERVANLDRAYAAEFLNELNN